MTPPAAQVRSFAAVSALAVQLLGGAHTVWAQPAPPAVAVETRAIPGRDVKQVNAQGLVDAPPHVVRAVLVDLERYPGFMPYVKESRVLSRDASGDARNYQRLSFGMPFVQDRHYVIRITEREYREAEGRRGWAFVWRLEDGLPSGVGTDAVRVSVNNGYWDVRPAAGGEGTTDLRYCVFTDPAGSLPKWLVGLANTEGIPQLFAAVAMAAKSPRYVSVPAPPAGTVLAERPSLGDCVDTPLPVR